MKNYLQPIIAIAITAIIVYGTYRISNKPIYELGDKVRCSGEKDVLYVLGETSSRIYAEKSLVERGGVAYRIVKRTCDKVEEQRFLRASTGVVDIARYNNRVE